jgi:hypothetical protein
MVIMLVDKLLRVFVIFDQDWVFHLDTNQALASLVALLDYFLGVDLFDVLLEPLFYNNRMVILHKVVHYRQDVIGVVVEDVLGRNILMLVLAIFSFHICLYRVNKILNVVERSALVFKHFFHLVFLTNLVE